MLGAAAALMVAFLLIESRIANPLMPLGIFRNRSVSTANILGALMAAGLFGYFFMSALYMQLVLGYSSMEVGLAYLPGTVLWGASSLLLSDRLVMRFGIKPPLITGLGLMTLGLSCSRGSPRTATGSSTSCRPRSRRASAPASPSTRSCWRP